MIRSALRRGTVIATLIAAALSLTAGAASASVPHWRTVPPPAVPAGHSAGSKLVPHSTSAQTPFIQVSG
jgi:hypothetical protein